MTDINPATLTRGDVAKELLTGNWEILNAVVKAKKTELTHREAITETYTDFLYYAEYYSGSDKEKMLNSIREWVSRNWDKAE